MIWDRKTTAKVTRHRVRIRKLLRTEELLRVAINSHRHLEPLQCDAEFMGLEFLPKLEKYRISHDQLLRAMATVVCERMAMEEVDEETYSANLEKNT